MRCNLLQRGPCKRDSHSFRNPMWYSVLQCVAVCCGVLRCVAVWCSSGVSNVTAALSYTQCVPCAAACCSVLQCIAVCYSVLQCVAIWACQTWQPPSHIPSVSQCVTMCCDVLQRVAMCNSLATSNASATPSYITHHSQPPSPPHPPFTCTQSFTNHTQSKEYAGLITHTPSLIDLPAYFFDWMCDSTRD